MARPATPARVSREWALWIRVALIGLALALATAVIVTSPAYAAPVDEVRATVDQFVVAQNAHDAAAVRALLLSWAFINQTPVTTADGWKVLSILPIPAPAQ